MASERILLVGKIVEGETHYRVSPLPVEEVPADGQLQDMIDYGAEAQELEDDMLDREFWSKGQW